MFGLGMSELVVIMIILVILFGARKLPEIGGGIGKGIMNFKNALTEKPKETQSDVTEKERPHAG